MCFSSSSYAVALYHSKMRKVKVNKAYKGKKTMIGGFKREIGKKNIFEFVKLPSFLFNICV